MRQTTKKAYTKQVAKYLKTTHQVTRDIQRQLEVSERILAEISMLPSPIREERFVSLVLAEHACFYQYNQAA